jgi:hybrid cluster-associated redox disulfide protein
MPEIPTPELMQMSIDEILRQWPQTAPVFRAHSLACVGCAVARFCTVTAVTEIYGLPAEKLCHDLEAVIRNQ